MAMIQLSVGTPLNVCGRMYSQKYLKNVEEEPKEEVLFWAKAVYYVTTIEVVSERILPYILFKC